MNRTIGMAGALTALCAAAVFAASMPVGALWVSYGSSMFIAFGFVLMMSAFAVAVPPDRRAVGPADDPRGVFRQLPGGACAGGVPGGRPRMGGRGSAGVLVRLLLPRLRAVSSPLPAE